MHKEISDKIIHIFSTYPVQRVSKGQVLIRAGEDPRGVFCLQNGHVQAYDISDKGEKIVVNVFRKGAFFPMSWAINKTPNQYFFEAVTDSTYRRAPAENIVAFLHQNPDVTFDLLSRVYSGTDGLLRRMTHLMGGTARTRLLFELLVQTRRFGIRKDDGSYLIKLNESELAIRAGLSRESVSRGLSNLKHIVLVSREGIHIHDFPALENELGDRL